jgi:hypothetical protein
MMILTAKQSRTVATATKVAVALLMASMALPAQTSRIQARIGNGNGANGKCTVEVEVDSVAEVEVSGTEARVRTLSGSAANLRRMDCTGPLPRNPADFRFQGVDGRGSQQLIRDPRQGGRAVVRIDDRDGGREGYTFDLLWSNNGTWDNSASNFPNGGINDTNDGLYGRGNSRGNRGDWRGQGRGGLSAANAGVAMRACQSEVGNRIRQSGYSDIQFLDVDFDNNRNRPDWIMGSARAVQTFGNDQFNFTCRVDLSSGRLGDVRVDRLRNGRR